MPLEPGTLLFDRYAIRRALKSGGMGAVYEATDMRLAGSPCAVKEILDEALTGRNSTYVIAKFRAEMDALAHLSHPDIPRVRDFFENSGKFYIVMDLIEGENLESELERTIELTRRPLDPAVAAADMVQVLAVLDYLHRQPRPLLHRDIKPANLIRETRTGRIKVVDFGLVTSSNGENTTMVGTPGYCAFEQMQGRPEPRSDLFSLGVTLHRLLTGRRPHRLYMVPLEEALPGCDPELARIVAKATAYQLENRYASAAEMSSDLRNWLALTTRVLPPPAARPRSHPGPVLISAAVLVLCGAALGRLSQAPAVLASPSGSPTATVVSPREVTPSPELAPFPHASLPEVASAPLPNPTPRPAPPVAVSKPGPPVRRGPAVITPSLGKEPGYALARPRAPIISPESTPEVSNDVPRLIVVDASRCLEVRETSQYHWSAVGNDIFLEPASSAQLNVKVSAFEYPGGAADALATALGVYANARSYWDGMTVVGEFASKGQAVFLRTQGVNRAQPCWGGFGIFVRPGIDSSIIVVVDMRTFESAGNLQIFDPVISLIRYRSGPPLLPELRPPTEVKSLPTPRPKPQWPASPSGQYPGQLPEGFRRPGRPRGF